MYIDFIYFNYSWFLDRTRYFKDTYLMYFDSELGKPLIKGKSL